MDMGDEELSPFAVKIDCRDNIVTVNLNLQPIRRDCTVRSFLIRGSYDGYLEGDISSINGHIFEELAENAALTICGVASHDDPIHVILPVTKGEEWLPAYVCFALLSSSPVEGRLDSAESQRSECLCCWFVDDRNKTISELVQQGVQPFDWEKVAVNRTC
jgi:hypothetical protein